MSYNPDEFESHLTEPFDAIREIQSDAESLKQEVEQKDKELEEKNTVLGTYQGIQKFFPLLRSPQMYNSQGLSSLMSSFRAISSDVGKAFGYISEYLEPRYRGVTGFFRKHFTDREGYAKFERLKGFFNTGLSKMYEGLSGMARALGRGAYDEARQNTDAIGRLYGL